ncbi:MAG: glycosyltransferase [Muribaculaceae bacterium]|nr:glycosyltransferase [Muribaculaceae bacterium]
MRTQTRGKRALIFIQNGLGGAERIQIEISKMLIADGWQIKFCMISFNSKENKIKQFYPENVMSSEIIATSQFGLLKDIFKQIKEYQPTVVFASAMHLNQRILLVSILFPKIKFIMRNENYLYTLPKWKCRTLGLTYRLADKIIVQTEEMENEVVNLGIKNDKVITLHNPVNEKEIHAKAAAPSPFPEDGKIRFVAVGRFAPQKGFDILVDAFRIVASIVPDAELYIVGDTFYGNGAVLKTVRDKAGEYNLTDRIFLPGFKSNPYPYMRHADVFVLSSRYEGLPNTLIEALFLGTPAATTTCIPIISRIITDGKNGYTATSGNAEELAKAMIEAAKLKTITNNYKPASNEEFIEQFNRLISQKH